jgi:hypothetical protein
VLWMWPESLHALFHCVMLEHHKPRSVQRHNRIAARATPIQSHEKAYCASYTCRGADCPSPGNSELSCAPGGLQACSFLCCILFTRSQRALPTCIAQQ